MTDLAERKRLLTFVVVGGGPTGVELAGELSDFIRDVARRFPKLDQTEPKVYLVHSGDGLLPQFDEPQRLECLRVMKSLGVDVMLKTRVDKVDEKHLVLSTNKKKEELPYGVAVWCAGTAPQPFMQSLLKRLPSASSANGKSFIAIDEWLRVRLDENSDNRQVENIQKGSILALGDCAHTAEILPPTAQVAAQQGAYAARFLNRNYDTASTPPTVNASLYENRFFEKLWLYEFRQAKAMPPFDFVNLGILAYLGGGKALAEVKFGDIPLGAYVGSTGYLLWKSVYLVKQVALRNRVLVTFDWIKASLFGRDITRL